MNAYESEKYVIIAHVNINQHRNSSIEREAVHDSLVIMLHRLIKYRLIALSPSSESLAPSSDSFVNPTKMIRYAVPFSSFF